jgi:hypothetical protein
MKRAGSTHMAANRNPELHSAVGLGLDRECSPMKQAPRVSESIPWNGFADDIARTGRGRGEQKEEHGHVAHGDEPSRLFGARVPNR